MSHARQTAISRAKNKTRHTRSAAEWVTIGMASAILLLIAGLVIYDWMITPTLPPIVSISRDGDILAREGQFYVPFVVKNLGGDTATAVEVVGELSIDGQVVEDGTQEIDFLSGAEAEAGMFIFSQDPRQGELVLRVASYQLP